MLFIKVIDVLSYLVAAGIFVWACVTTDAMLFGISVLVLVVGQYVVQMLKTHIGYNGSLKDEFFERPWWQRPWWW